MKEREDPSSVTADINPDEYYPDDAPDLNRFQRFRIRVFKMVSVGVVDDFINQMYDTVSILALLINLTATILSTYNGLDSRFGAVFDYLEGVTIAFFAVDYVLRLFTANCLYPYKNEWKSLVKYIFSFTGIVDLLSFMPYYLPAFFPAGAAVFRMFRVARILRLFRINAYYDSLNVIAEVILRKKQQLMSSVFIILVLMLAASLCMYSIENPYQPEVFSNAFSGIWWSASTLLTVGYGDIYPVTTLGKTFGIFIAFLGVGMVAIPTGIISAGFVEQYSRLSNIDDLSDADIRFIKMRLNESDSWVGKRIAELSFPQGMLIAVIQRGDATVIPKASVVLKEGDVLVIGAEAIKDEKPVYLRKIPLKANHRWIGQRIKDLDISRQSVIVMVKRGEASMQPKGSLILSEGDTVIMYSKVRDKAFDSSSMEQEV